MQQGSQDVAQHLSREIAKMGPYRLITDGSDLPVFAFALAPEVKNYTVFDVSDRLRQQGWLVPAYTFPENRQDLSVLRVVVRAGMTHDMADHAPRGPARANRVPRVAGRAAAGSGAPRSAPRSPTEPAIPGVKDRCRNSDRPLPIDAALKDPRSRGPMTAAMHKRLIRLGSCWPWRSCSCRASTQAAQAQTPIRHSSTSLHRSVHRSGWEPDRTDMGVDWFVTRPLPVLAIGDAVIVGSDSHDAGWPGGHFIWYRLLDGSHAGDIIYVAEHLTHLLPAGAHVRAGQKIAEALPGGTGTEWGWAERRRRHPRQLLLPRGRGDRLRPGDGALHEVSWGTGPGPPGSRTRSRTVRKALLTDGT